MEASAQQRGGYLKLSRLSVSELIGMGFAVVLALSLLLPWFTTSDTNPNSKFVAGGETIARDGESVTGWEAFPILRWILLAAASAPFILAWIVARGHKLSWKPGEVTMIVGATAVLLVLCNGVILGKPGGRNPVEIDLNIGWFVGLISAFFMGLSGFRRQASYEGPKKPPGEI